jgi:fluoroquinolone resistance protein
MKEPAFIENKTFSKIDFTQSPIGKGEYEYCSFINCDFSNSDFSEIQFAECVFDSCNLSMVILVKTALRDIKFRNCKMLGLHFENCNKFGLLVYFEGCNLNHSSFYQAKLKNTIFKIVKLQEVDFTESDLSSSVFDNCDLTGATFENSNIEKADFRSAYNFCIDPGKNRIKKARFSLSGIAGLLTKYDLDLSN